METRPKGPSSLALERSVFSQLLQSGTIALAMRDVPSPTQIPMHIYNHHALYIGLLQCSTALVVVYLWFFKRVNEQSDVWFRWAYIAIVGYSLASCARNLILATFLLSNRFDITDYLFIVSWICIITSFAMSFIGNTLKRREAKLRLLPVAETPIVDSWPPAPKAE